MLNRPSFIVRLLVYLRASKCGGVYVPALSSVKFVRQRVGPVGVPGRGSLRPPARDEIRVGGACGPRRQSLLRSQARYALLPAATPRDVLTARGSELAHRYGIRRNNSLTSKH